MTAESLATLVPSTFRMRYAKALDIALTEQWRRHGDVRFEVIGMRVNERGEVVFEVCAR